MNKDLKILLMQPSKQQEVQSLFTFHKDEGLGAKPPLGIMILATFLIKNGFKNTSCFDAQLENLSPEQSVDFIVKESPDLVGLTVWTDFWYPAYKTISLLKEKLPKCKIVLGGPHCIIYPEETLLSSKADYLISGDGEEALLAVTNKIAFNEPLEGIDGLWKKENGSIIAPDKPIATIRDLSKIPNPDRTLLPYRKYNSLLNPNEYETTMITSRGCPHRCVFCKMHRQEVYARSPEQVVSEFCEIANLGISEIQVYDDTFTWSHKRVKEICEGILDNKLDLRWAVRDRVNRADQAMYKLMKRAGCYRIHFGVESGSPRVLEASKKAITLSEVENAMKLAREAGFITLTYFMFGFLDETYEDALKTMHFATKINSDYAVFAVLIPYPGTDLYEEALKRNLIPFDFWKKFAINPTPDFEIPFLIEQHMDRAKLLGLKDQALRRFYFRPSRMLKELYGIRSIKELKSKLGMAKNILVDSFYSVKK